jgi:hypothetical protein
MTDLSLLSPWVRRFLLEYLVSDRNLARNTQRSYRDTFTDQYALAVTYCKLRSGALLESASAFCRSSRPRRNRSVESRRCLR